MGLGVRVGESPGGGSAKVEVGERVERMMKSGRGVVWKSGAGKKKGQTYYRCVPNCVFLCECISEQKCVHAERYVKMQRAIRVMKMVPSTYAISVM